MKDTQKSRNSHLYIWGFPLAIFGISRLLLWYLGVDFVFDEMLEYMHFLDRAWLQTELFDSIIYLHAFPPIPNLFTGLGLKVFSEYSAQFWGNMFMLMGAVQTVCIAQLLWQSLPKGRFKKFATLGLATLYCLYPATIYFENCFLHTYPSATLLLMLLVALQAALQKQQKVYWFLFLVCAALLALSRSLFHLVWLLACLGICWRWGNMKGLSFFKISVLPLSLVLGFYLKNLIIFGFFGLSSWGGMSLAKQTTMQIPIAERMQLIQAKKLHSMTQYWVFASPKAYSNFVSMSPVTGISALDKLSRPSCNRPNYNHRIYLNISEIHLRQGIAYISEHPAKYAQQVAFSFQDFFRPSSRWHPKDPQGSPFIQNRSILESYENIWNMIFQSWFYILVLIICLIKFIKNKKSIYGNKILLFIIFNLIWILLISCLLESGELERMRFMVEGMLWVGMASMLSR